MTRTPDWTMLRGCASKFLPATRLLECTSAIFVTPLLQTDPCRQGTADTRNLRERLPISSPARFRLRDNPLPRRTPIRILRIHTSLFVSPFHEQSFTADFHIL